jgi:RHS repeat-associated protein
VKYATYTRDSATGMDYADQRYYSNQFGRFMTPDPYKASGGPQDPGSWNRYAYVGGDPINFADVSGREKCDPGQGCFSVTVTAPAPEDLPGLDTDPFYDGSTTFQIDVYSAGWNPVSATRNLLRQLAAQRAQARSSVPQDLSLALAALDQPDCAKYFGTPATRAGAWDPRLPYRLYSQLRAVTSQEHRHTWVTKLVTTCSVAGRL